MKIKVSILGMSCSHCVAAVEESLKNVEGVESAKASLGDNSALVEGTHLTTPAIEAAIDNIGFEVRNIEIL